MNEAKDVKLQATARVEPGGLTIEYLVENLGSAPLYVMHLDFYSGQPSAALQRLREKEAFVFFGTPKLPPGLMAAWPPRPAGVPLRPEEKLMGRLGFAFPLRETGMSPRSFVPFPPQPEPPMDEVPLEWLYLAMEIRPAPRKAPPKASCGAFDLYSVDTPTLYVTASTDIENGPCKLLKLRDGISMIDYVLPREMQRK